MKNFALLLTLVSLLFSANLSAQETDTRTFEEFDHINVSGNIDVTLTKGESNLAEIELEETTLDDLVTEVKNNVLIIKFKKKGMMSWKSKRKANIELSYTNLEGIDVSAGSSVISNAPISTKSFEIEASSGASAKVKLDVTEVDADASSGADIKVSGIAENSKVDVSSGASYYGDKLEAKNVDVDVSSGASAKVWVTKDLEAEVSSGGSVKYKGDPDKIDTDSGFSGSISKIKAKKSRRD